MSASASSTSARSSSRSSPAASASISRAAARSSVPAPQRAGRADDRLELAVALGHLLVAGLVGDQVGVAEARLEVEELLLQLIEAFEHSEPGYRRRHTAPYLGERPRAADGIQPDSAEPMGPVPGRARGPVPYPDPYPHLPMVLPIASDPTAPADPAGRRTRSGGGAPVARDGHDRRRHPQPGGEPAGAGVVVALGDGEDQVRRRGAAWVPPMASIARRPSAAVGTRSSATPTVQATITGSPSPSAPTATPRHARPGSAAAGRPRPGGA